MEPIFLGKVLDLVRLGIGRSWRMVTGESGAEPLRKFFLGGATGTTVSLALGGNKGGLTVCCDEAAVAAAAEAAVFDKAFLT